MVSPSVEILAPAKINLFLHVTDRRENGYHELESLFVFTGFGDRLIVSSADRFGLDSVGPFSGILNDLCPSVQDNLILKAAHSLAEFAKAKGVGVSPVKVILEKNIPIAAGVGGGSADAAALLLGLVDFWDLDIKNEEMHDIALALGADVPACLSLSPKWVTGIGEIIQDIGEMPSFHVVLVNPCVPLSTPEVFAGFHDINSPYEASIPQQVSYGSFEELIGFLKPTKNSLQDAALALEPQIAQMLESLNQQEGCALARMSGSGPTCFGVFEKFEDAEAALTLLEQQYPDWWAESASVIGK